MVAERPVVGVFLNGHDLNGVVAVGDDAGQYFFSELVVAANAFVFLCHAYVALVDEQGGGIGCEVFLLEFGDILIEFE